MGQPAYKNVYDPYMPYMEPGGPIVNRPYATAAEYGNEYASYPGPYAEPIITDQTRERRQQRRAQHYYMPRRQTPNRIQNAEFIPTMVNRTGLRPDAQYGGYQEEPSLNGSMQQGQEMYMSPQQVAQFMAAGGVVEFLD